MAAGARKDAGSRVDGATGNAHDTIPHQPAPMQRLNVQIFVSRPVGRSTRAPAVVRPSLGSKRPSSSMTALSDATGPASLCARCDKFDSSPHPRAARPARAGSRKR